MTKLLIGGELVAGDGPALDVEDPARAEVHATVALPSEEQVDAAIAAAREAAARVGRDAGGRARARCSTRSPRGSARRPTSSRRS